MKDVEAHAVHTRPHVAPFLLVPRFSSHFLPLTPAHCRRNHFTTTSNAGKIDRVAALLGDPRFPTAPVEQARTLIDLYIVSVLLDAGAGNEWSYSETVQGVELWRGGRSEGLAVASFHMFCQGAFSSDPNVPLRVDCKYLCAVLLDRIGQRSRQLRRLRASRLPSSPSTSR